MINTIKTFNDIVNIVEYSNKSRIFHYLSELCSSSLANKNQGMNTPIFSTNIPAIRSIYGSATNIFHNKERTMSDNVESCCDFVLGDIKNTGFRIYSPADGLLAYFCKKYYKNMQPIAK